MLYTFAHEVLCLINAHGSKDRVRERLGRPVYSQISVHSHIGFTYVPGLSALFAPPIAEVGFLSCA